MQRLPLPFPNGWFRVAYSSELAPGEVIPRHYFGKDLVLFRANDGMPYVLDAYCPHLGTHLGYGGRVEGSALRCPFHGWLWDGIGRCLEVPYARKVPPRAQMRAWPVREINGIIWVYYHAQAESPRWEVPEFPEYISPEWLPCRPVRRWTIRSHPQELAENGVDIAHVPFLHCHIIRAITSDVLEVDGPILVHRMSLTFNTPWVDRLMGRESAGTFEATVYGPGCGVGRARVQGLIEFRTIHILLATPIDEELLEVHAVFSMKKVLNRAFTWALAAKVIREEVRSIEQDIQIWENKAYWSNPLLCDSDGPIMQFRRWARQFYSDPREGGCDTTP